MQIFLKLSKEVEVRAAKPDQEVLLELMESYVSGVEAFGKAAWRHPDEFVRFFEKFSDKFRMGPTTVEEIIERLGLFSSNEGRAKEIKSRLSNGLASMAIPSSPTKKD